MMRLLRWAAVLLGLTAATAAASAQDCESGASNMDQVRACLSDKSEKQLDQTYDDTLSFVRARDPKAADLLAAAQQSWVKFANDSCDYTARASTPANSYSADTRLNCWVTFVDARIKVIKAYRREFIKRD